MCIDLLSFCEIMYQGHLPSFMSYNQFIADGLTMTQREISSGRSELFGSIMAMRAMRHMWSDILQQVFNLAIEFQTFIAYLSACLTCSANVSTVTGDLEVTNIRPHVSTQIVFVSAPISEIHTSEHCERTVTFNCSSIWRKASVSSASFPVDLIS